MTRLDNAGLRRAAEAGSLPAELRDLAPSTGPLRRRAATTGANGSDVALTELLRALTPTERHGRLTDLIRRQAAAVLGHTSIDGVGADRPFRELGFDSMMSIQLRNRIGAETGLTLPAVVAFTYPTPAALADHLAAQLGIDGVADNGEARALAELDRLEAFFAALGPETAADTRSRVGKRLQALLWRWTDAPERNGGPAPEAVVDDRTLESATDDEMFALIDRELEAP